LTMKIVPKVFSIIQVSLLTVINCTRGTPMKSIRYYSAIFLICFLLAGCGTSSVYLPEDIPSENNSLKKAVALDGVTTIWQTFANNVCHI